MKRLASFALAAVLAAPCVSAQTSPPAPSGSAPLVLQLPGSTRALSLGNVDVAGRDVDVIFYNPAQLAGARGMSASAERYRGSSALGTLAGVIAFGTGGLGIGVQILDFDTPAGGYPPSASALFGRGPVVASSLAATIGFGGTFKGISLGASGKFIEDRYGNARDGRMAFDLGASDDYGPVTIGLAVQNLGEDVRLAAGGTPLPRRVTLGFAGGGLPAGIFDFGATGAVSLGLHGRVIPAAGVELSWNWLEGYTLSGRAGVRAVDRDAESPVTLGGGISVDRLTLDYAFEPFTGGRSAHRVGLRVR